MDEFSGVSKSETKRRRKKGKNTFTLYYSKKFELRSWIYVRRLRDFCDATFNGKQQRTTSEAAKKYRITHTCGDKAGQSMYTKTKVIPTASNTAMAI